MYKDFAFLNEKISQGSYFYEVEIILHDHVSLVLEEG